MSVDSLYFGQKKASYPPFYAYMSEFVHNDIIADPVFKPNKRSYKSQISANRIWNYRTGLPGLECIYGSNIGDGEFSFELKRSMRSEKNKGKLRLPFSVKPSSIKTNKSQSKSFKRYLESIGAKKSNEILAIGDARNTLNKHVFDIHLTFILLHNKAVDWLREQEDNTTLSPDELFYKAKKLTIFHYQWLIVNDYLRVICRQDVLDYVLSTQAAIYQKFLDDDPRMDGKGLPLPMEFSTAGFQFWSSMSNVKSTESLYTFHANDYFYNSPHPDLASDTELNQDVIQENTAYKSSIQWAQLLKKYENSMNYAANKISALSSQDNVDTAFSRLLYTEHLKIPSAQTCIKRINEISQMNITPLKKLEIESGHTGEVARKNGFTEKTPLWFYILKESEIREAGERLGMLGSTLVCETIIGVLLNHPDSYFNAKGSDSGHWGIMDGVRDKQGQPISDFSHVFEISEML